MRPVVVVSSEALIARKRPAFHLTRGTERPICGASLWHGFYPDADPVRSPLDPAPTSRWVPMTQEYAAAFARPCVACYKALSATFAGTLK